MIIHTRMKEVPHLDLQLLLEGPRDSVVEDMEETPRLAGGGDLSDSVCP